MQTVTCWCQDRRVILSVGLRNRPYQAFFPFWSHTNNNNIFQAKIMPHSHLCCSAHGQLHVRHAHILQHGRVKTKLLAKHQGRAHNLVIEPGLLSLIFLCLP